MLSKEFGENKLGTTGTTDSGRRQQSPPEPLDEKAGP